MGAGFHGGFGGTYGAKANESGSLIKELERNGVKFTKDNIVFITKDQTGQIVWLETGNASTGLQHIVARHAKDFEEKHGVAQSQISDHLNKVFNSGKIEYNRITNRNGRMGYERLYSYNGKYYLQTGVETNGYIVSAYPVSSSEAIKLIERYK